MTITPGKKREKIDRLAELAAVRDDERGVSLWQEAFRRLRRNPAAIVGAVILALFVLVAVVGPFLVPYGATDSIGIREGVVKSGQGIIPGPSGDHWLGYDHQGRDVFSRMIVGARQTLLVGVVSTLIGLAVGALIGGVAGAAAGLGGRWGRWVDSTLMRFVDMLLALPSLLLAVSVAALLGASLTTVMIAVGVVSVPVFARLLRGSMISQSNSDYVLAATSLGVKRSRIALTHVVPNSLAPVIVQATLTLATAIIEAAALSFLGLGNPDSTIPEWGVMLADAQPYLGIRPALAIYPAVAIIITALGFTLLGEAMREALDPKLRK
ncbi:ABC transporter permease [Micromonospora echinospora]|uniref:Peptide/nickel transport system permease protein n=1 Tax=Micromonospora echinospora TaxID=1877 RepID=A0A1C4WP26_MICEC|nr:MULTISPECIES: ABC transporter permease [Micromonospora]OZV79619.1 ABC transporter permease [Micromonospora echinospora]GLY25392.1 ABC transporter permease [Micromonospora sp. NBRC 101691]SCE97919.1 peptide/nickel transport system permease protein [Micromonospora echinospora]